MCGIAGLVEADAGSSCDHLVATARAMADALEHRGPDDAGAWADAAAGVALGHRRLSIVDLSQEGHQPMASASGRYALTYNGEIYNFRDLRGELERRGVRFRGHSDTEVLLAGVEAWGLTDTLRRANGMFAFALWDRTTRELHLVRDRLGEKPLYYGWAGRAFLFGSELRALRRYPNFDAKIDRRAVALFLRYNCVPAPYSIYEGVWKLPPACTLTVPLPLAPGWLPEPELYWSLRDAAEHGARNRSPASASELTEELDALLLDAVKMRTYADVPVGAFLSGGIDSSTVVALMQRDRATPVRTFTIGFAERAYDESTDAEEVAAHLGTDHVTMRVTAADALDAIPRLPHVFDEPFSDPSQLPTLLLSELTRRQVTVSLSGDGGDELFGGYNRHTWSQRVHRATSLVPTAALRAAGGAISRVSARRWDTFFERMEPVLGRRLRVRTPGTKVHKLAQVLTAPDMASMYATLVSHWQEPEQVALGSVEPLVLQRDSSRWPALPNPVEQMMFVDAASYLPDDILAKVDRAAMAVSLETRVPFLDHRVVEFSWRVPLRHKIKDGQGKWLLRQVLRKYVPDALIDRPKMGFGMPIGEWLRGPLRDWAEELLRPERLANEGLLDAGAVRQVFDAHQRGAADRQYELWDVLMFQAWLETQ
jgi:asparagine synthase (glutamine-hydrolysing)